MALLNRNRGVVEKSAPRGARPSPAPLTITIVGGGLAGLTLGIGLRRQSIPVVIWERGHYPRHRVCGEFISGRGQESLQRLDLLELLLSAGTHTASTAAFFSQTRGFPIRVLPQPAVCLSRFTLDALLAARFQELGGELRCGAHFPQMEGREGIVRASGRRVEGVTEGWHWFGLKAHAHNLTLEADLEMHAGENGYVGLCRLPGGMVNVCGLFRRQRGEADSTRSVVKRLRGDARSLLHKRLETARFDEESCCAVGGLGLSPRRGAGAPECCVGDSFTMIPPVTGNGMSMAFESAELAIAPLTAFARGEIQWAKAQQAVAWRCDRAFASRLRWAKWLQKLLLCSTGQRHLLPRAFGWDACWRFLFWATR